MRPLYVYLDSVMQKIMIRHWLSPAGEMIIGSAGQELCISDWTGNPRRMAVDMRICHELKGQYEEGLSPVIEQAIRQLEEYFSGSRKMFDIPLRITGTDFQCAIRAELIKIPYGLTVSYAALADKIGNPKAVRAVANAIATNPLSIFVPCHRVIGSDGALCGYAGGISAKKHLLTLEHRHAF